MKLFLFRPSEQWSYCGGAIAAIAESFEDVEKLIHKEFEEANLFKNEYESLKYWMLHDISWDLWVLDSVFEVPLENSSYVVLFQKNWA